MLRILFQPSKPRAECVHLPRGAGCVFDELFGEVPPPFSPDLPITHISATAGAKGRRRMRWDVALRSTMDCTSTENKMCPV